MSVAVTIQPNQSLLDIVIQQHGNLQDLLINAKANVTSITDALTAGEVLHIENADAPAIAIVAFYDKNNITPATAFTASAGTEPTAEGIGDMIIEDTFIVQ